VDKYCYPAPHGLLREKVWVRLTARRSRSSTIANGSLADAAFQGSPDSLAKFRVAAPNLARDCHGSQSRRRFQHGHDRRVKGPRQGIRSPPVTRRPLARRRLRILLKPITRGRAETSLGCRDGHRVGQSILHEKPDLMIG